jgi:hypothetical protein
MSSNLVHYYIFLLYTTEIFISSSYKEPPGPWCLSIGGYLDFGMKNNEYR